MNLDLGSKWSATARIAAFRLAASMSVIILREMEAEVKVPSTKGKLGSVRGLMCLQAGFDNDLIVFRAPLFTKSSAAVSFRFEL